MEYIGFDPGMGAIKMWDSAGGTTLPSFVSKGGGKTYAKMMGASKSESALSVTFDGRSYNVGRNAHSAGRAIENMGFDRLTGSPEIKALFYGSLTKRINEHGKYNGSATVFVALPVEMMTSENNKENAAAVKKWMKGVHSWQSNGSEYGIAIEDVKVTSQPLGALFDYVLAPNGKPIAARSGAIKGEVGIVSVGFNTLEVLYVSNKAIVDHLTSGKKVGVRRLLRNADPQKRYTLGELDDRLRRDLLSADSVVMDEWSSEVTGVIEETWGDTWNRFDAVITVGGGSILLNGHLSKYFDDSAHIPADPVMSIAHGLYRFINKG